MLCWLDLETDGLDARQNVILELGIVVTDDELTEIARASWVLHYVRAAGVFEPPAHVVEMHTATGLFEECARSFLRDRDVARMAINFLEELGVPRAEVPLCGSSVHFDRSFLREWMPELDSYFHRRIVDVSVLLELAKRWYPSVYQSAPDKPHRALADLDRSIALLKTFRQEMFR